MTQAARFRVYALGDKGEVLGEVNHDSLLDKLANALNECLVGRVMLHIIISVLGRFKFHDEAMSDAILEEQSARTLIVEIGCYRCHLPAILRASCPALPSGR